MGRIHLNRSFRLILLNNMSVCNDYARYIGVIADRHPHTDIQRTKKKNGMFLKFAGVYSHNTGGVEDSRDRPRRYSR